MKKIFFLLLIIILFIQCTKKNLKKDYPIEIYYSNTRQLNQYLRKEIPYDKTVAIYEEYRKDIKLQKSYNISYVLPYYGIAKLKYIQFDFKGARFDLEKAIKIDKYAPAIHRLYYHSYRAENKSYNIHKINDIFNLIQNNDPDEDIFSIINIDYMILNDKLAEAERNILKLQSKPVLGEDLKIIYKNRLTDLKMLQSNNDQDIRSIGCKYYITKSDLELLDIIKYFNLLNTNISQTNQQYFISINNFNKDQLYKLTKNIENSLTEKETNLSERYDSEKYLNSIWTLNYEIKKSKNNLWFLKEKNYYLSGMDALFLREILKNK